MLTEFIWLLLIKQQTDLKKLENYQKTYKQNFISAVP